MQGQIRDVGVVFLLLLAIVVVFALIARRIRTPYPIVLVIAGALLGLVPRAPSVSLSPDVVFFGVLPPLVFAAAWTTSWRDFSHNLARILSLACGLVAITVVAVAVAAPFLFAGFTWRLGALLGAIVAPTDTIAATQIAAQIGLRHRIVTVLEGEGLVNDATGLLALEFGASVAMGHPLPTVGSTALYMIYVVLGSIGLGLGIAYAVYGLERRIDDAPIEITVTLLVPYAVYLAAAAASLSGVLAVMTSALFLSRRSVSFFSPTVRLQVYAVWGAVVFILNGVVFTVVGLQLPSIVEAIAGSEGRLPLRDAFVFTALIVALRLAVAFPGARVAHAIRRRFLHHRDERPGAGEVVVIGWAGMRGAIALAAAVGLPAAMPHRSEIIFLTFSVVLATLVGQGLTLAPLARAAGVAGAEPDDSEIDAARRAGAEAALEHLDAARAADDGAFAGVYDDLAQHYRERLAALSGADGGAEAGGDPRVLDRYNELARDLAGVERRAVVRLRDEGRIGDETLREVERDLDLREARLREL